jgi:hypothetical protein
VLRGCDGEGHSGTRRAPPVDREPGPPPTARYPGRLATSRRPARRPGVLGPVAPVLESLGPGPRHRRARHGRALAPRRVPHLLELAVPTRKALRPSSPASGGPSTHPEDGHRESLGRAKHSRRVAVPRLRCLRAQRFQVPVLPIPDGRRDVVRCAVTSSPTAAWVAQQLREALPFESAPRLLIFIRDAIFSAGLTATIRSMLMEPRRTSYRSPWQNGVAERFAGTVRRWRSSWGCVPRRSTGSASGESRPIFGC